MFCLQGREISGFLVEGLVQGLLVGLQGDELVYGGCLCGGLAEGSELGLKLSDFELEGANCRVFFRVGGFEGRDFFVLGGY